MLTIDTNQLRAIVKRGTNHELALFIASHAPAGFEAVIDQARSTESVYVIAGPRSETGGICTKVKIRLSSHRAPCHRSLGSKRDRMIRLSDGSMSRHICCTDSTQKGRVRRVIEAIAAMRLHAHAAPEDLYALAGQRAGLIWG